MAKFSQGIQQDTERLRQAQASHRADVDRIMGDERLSDLGKAEKIKALSDSVAAQLKYDSKMALTRAQIAGRKVAAERQTLHREYEASKDFAKIDILSRQLRVRYTEPDGVFSTNARTAAFARDYDAALELGDLDRARALRLIGAEIFANASPNGGTDAQRARTLYQRVRQDDANDVPPGSRELEQEAADVAFATKLLEGEILQTERVVTGVTHSGMFREFSEWERELFGRTMEERVRWAGPPAVVAGDTPDEAAG